MLFKDLKKDSIEQQSVDAAKQFLMSAIDALHKLNFDDYNELMDSYNIESKLLDDMSVEAGSDHWDEYAYQYMQLYYYHMIATFCHAKYLLFSKQCEEKDIHQADGILDVLCEQAKDFNLKLHDSPDQCIEQQKFLDLSSLIYKKNLWEHFLSLQT